MAFVHVCALARELCVLAVMRWVYLGLSCLKMKRERERNLCLSLAHHNRITTTVSQKLIHLSTKPANKQTRISRYYH